MNYAHIIYNSSEKSQSGTVGFGVRCSTEGTPQEMNDLLERNDIFSFTESGENVTPSALFENPELIKGVVPSYFFRVLSWQGKSKVYVLGRKIAVGFDYTFYLNGKPGRLGNYVVDTYVLTDVPTAREFEIFLENAASGSNHFIPESPAPVISNQEMASISVGFSPVLPQENRPFDAKQRPTISKSSIELLFAFIKSRKEGKPLLVKADVESPATLMAQLALLVPSENIEDLTFITNHTDEGKKQGVNIVFINDYYPYEVFRKQWVILDLTAGESVSSREADSFRTQLEGYVSGGDIDSVHKLVGWCFSPLYDKAGTLSSTSQAQIFNYLYDYPAFDLNKVASDQDLRIALAEYFAENSQKSKPLKEAIQQWYDSIENLTALFDWMDFVLAIRPIDCSDIINENRYPTSCAIFEEPATFMAFYDRFANRFAEVQQFIDSKNYTFPKYNNYLSEAGDRWEALYAYFLAPHKGDNEYLIERMLRDNLPASVRNRIISKEIFPAEKYVRSLINILKKGDLYIEEAVIRLLEEQLNNATGVNVDFFTELSSRIADSRYAMLFSWQLESSSARAQTEILSLTRNLLAFCANDSALLWAAKRGSNVFIMLYRNVIKAVSEHVLNVKDAAEVCRGLIASPYPTNALEPFSALSDVLAGKINPADHRMNELWNIAFELNDKEYLHSIAPHKFALLESGMAGKQALHNANELSDLTTTILDNGIMTADDIMEIASTSKMKQAYVAGILHHESWKPQQQLDFMTGKAGMTDDDALEFMSRHFPESHRKILKSRQPSPIAKMGGFFKGLFANRNKTSETESSKENNNLNPPQK